MVVVVLLLLAALALVEWNLWLLVVAVDPVDDERQKR